MCPQIGPAVTRSELSFLTKCFPFHNCLGPRGFFHLLRHADSEFIQDGTSGYFFMQKHVCQWRIDCSGRWGAQSSAREIGEGYAAVQETA